MMFYILLCSKYHCLIHIKVIIMYLLNILPDSFRPCTFKALKACSVAIMTFGFQVRSLQIQHLLDPLPPPGFKRDSCFIIVSSNTQVLTVVRLDNLMCISDRYCSASILFFHKDLRIFYGFVQQIPWSLFPSSLPQQVPEFCLDGSAVFCCSSYHFLCFQYFLQMNLWMHQAYRCKSIF